MRLSLIDLNVKRKYGLPEDWHIFKWQAMPENGPKTYSLVTGAVAPLKEGSTDPIWDRNWKKMDKSSKATLTVTDDEHRAFLDQWEAETGKCRECEGSGKEMAHSGPDGTTYRPCFKCKGTGCPPKQNYE